jgi:hypothetical protein
VQPPAERAPATHRYLGNRARLAFGVLCGVVAAIGLLTFAGAGFTGVGAGGLAAALAAAAGYMVAVRRLRARGVRIEPGRLGWVGSDGRTTRWCELDEVVLATVHEHSAVFGGVQQDLVLWREAGGGRGLGAMVTKMGMSADQRRRLAEVEAARGAELVPFVVEISDLPEGVGAAILDHVRHLR